MAKVMNYQMKVTLLGVKPQIWRRIEVSEELNLKKLHQVIQIVMGWKDCHLHEFTVAGARYGAIWSGDDDPPLDERKVKVKDVAARCKVFGYEYDFGDEWEHEIRIEKAIEDGILLPAQFIDGRRAGPPEDCGGPLAYMDLVKVVSNPRHPDFKEKMAWLGRRKYDAEKIDERKIHLTLGNHGPRLTARELDQVIRRRQQFRTRQAAG